MAVPPGIVWVACRALSVESGDRFASNGSSSRMANWAFRRGDLEGDLESKGISNRGKDGLVGVVVVVVAMAQGCEDFDRSCYLNREEQGMFWTEVCQSNVLDENNMLSKVDRGALAGYEIPCV